MVANEREGASAVRIDHSDRRNKIRAEARYRCVAHAFPRTRAPTLEHPLRPAPKRLTNRSKRELIRFF